MTVVDVNTGKFVGSGGNLEETVTKNNLEAAEEIVRQLRLRDIGGIIVVDFIDMVLESNRDLVLRRLVECLSRDRTKHQVAEVTSLGLVQMTRKKLGLGLLESFSEPCEVCAGRGIVVHHEPVLKHRAPQRRARTRPWPRSRRQPAAVAAGGVARAAHGYARDHRRCQARARRDRRVDDSARRAEARFRGCPCRGRDRHGGAARIRAEARRVDRRPSTWSSPPGDAGAGCRRGGLAAGRCSCAAARSCAGRRHGRGRAFRERAQRG